MSTEPDRIAVPTNGKGPHPLTSPLPPLRGEPPTAEPLHTFSPTDPALLGSVSPKQLAIGFGVVASLVLLALGRSRRRPGR
jgi:hypothetical protein